MSGPTFSPDGNWMWNGTDWIPAPPKEQVLPQSSIDEKEVTNVATESGVDPGHLTQVAPYFDENKDRILQQTEIQQAAMSIAHEPDVPSPEPVMPQQPVAPMAPAAPMASQQPVSPVAPIAPIAPVATVAPEPMVPAVPQQPADQLSSKSTALATSSSGKGKMIVAISLVAVLILGSLFYLWNDNSEDEDEEKEPLPEFIGKWDSVEFEGSWVEFKSDGTVCDDEDGCNSEWEIEDGLLKVTNESGWIYLMEWDVKDGELSLDYISIKNSDGVEELGDEDYSLSFISAQSEMPEIVGTWVFCHNEITESCDEESTLYNVTFKNNETLIHPMYQFYPEVTYSVEGNKMQWDARYNATLSSGYQGQYEINGDVMYVAWDKLMSNGNETATTMAAFTAVNYDSFSQEPETIENWNDIIAENDPGPSWFSDYVEFGKENLAGDSNSDDLETYQFSARDAPESLSSSGMEDLVYVEMTQGDSLNWSDVGISFTIDDSVSYNCELYYENSTDGCTYVTGAAETWSTSYEVLISEGEESFCGEFSCNITVSIKRISDGTTLGQASTTIE